MDIKKVWMEEGCIACGACEIACPEVFRIEDIAYVNEGVDFPKFTEQIKEAAEAYACYADAFTKRLI